MTQPTPPSRSRDRAIARDVAKQLDRRRTRRRLTVWTGLLALIIAAASYLRFGGGFGALGLGGGSGDGEDHGEGEEHRPVNHPTRCAVRISAAAITVGGKPMTRDEAVAACKGTPGADVVVTGDTREGDWQDLRAALEAAGIVVQLQRHPAGPTGGTSR
jgi:hypothetical protein